jgi:hypothetical protein
MVARYGLDASAYRLDGIYAEAETWRPAASRQWIEGVRSLGAAGLNQLLPESAAQKLRAIRDRATR